MQEKIRRHYIFYGWVQGVGFRFRAKHSAMLYSVTGWVKNLSDGSVEMEAEGTEEAIDKMILNIEKSDYIKIENLEIKDIPVEGSRSFEYKW